MRLVLPPEGPALSRPGAVYIASDLHLGVPDAASSRQREVRFVNWLRRVRADAAEIILLGDVFDFWFEYNMVVPKGYTRLLGALAETVDSGVPVTFFTGNHDLWVRSYFTDELGIRVTHTPEARTFFGERYFLAHGDGLGPGDRTYKFTKAVFVNPFFQWLFRNSHPSLGMGLGMYFSGRSAKKSRMHDAHDYGDKEQLLQFVQAHTQAHPGFRYYVFGHRHMVKRQDVGSSTLMYIGDWISRYSYLRIGAETGPQLLYDA